MKERFFKWFYGESDPMEHILDCAEVPDESREEWKYEEHEIEREISRRVHTQSVIRAELRKAGADSLSLIRGTVVDQQQFHVIPHLSA